MIEQNLAKPGFGVRALQSQLQCSRAALYRAFAADEGGVREFITDMRIARAKTLLERSPHLPVGLVAARCGWHDGASFSRAFRRSTGMSPSDYREDRHSRDQRRGM
jgi:AraC-like DNA-binding protein